MTRAFTPPFVALYHSGMRNFCFFEYQKVGWYFWIAAFVAP